MSMWVINCNKCGDVSSEVGYARVGVGVYGNSVFPLNFVVNLKLL